MITDYIDSEAADIILDLIDTDYKNKLVAAYITLQLGHDEIDSHKDIADALNEELGLRTKVQRLMDWRNGARPCPKRVAAYMRRVLLEYIFADEAAEALIALLSLDYED